MMTAQEELNNKLIKASEHGSISLVKRYLKDGADVHYNSDYAVQLASQRGHLKLVMYLIKECGADVNASGGLALDWASNYGHLNVVRYLIESAGADVHADDDSALRRALHCNQTEVVNYLQNYKNIIRLEKMEGIE